LTRFQVADGILQGVHFPVLNKQIKAIFVVLFQVVHHAGIHVFQHVDHES